MSREGVVQGVLFQREGEPETNLTLLFSADRQLTAEEVVTAFEGAVRDSAEDACADVLAYAGDDLNIGDLDSHGVLSDDLFLERLAAHGIRDVSVPNPPVTVRLPYDTLFARDFEGVD